MWPEPRVNEAAFADPAGDAGSAADATAVAVRNDDRGIVTIRVALANRQSFGEGDLYLVSLDTDRNPETGGVGFEYLIVVEGAGDASILRWDGATWAPTPPVAQASWDGALEVSFDRAAVGSPAAVDFQLAIGTETSTDSDAAPDDGTWSYQIVIQPPSTPAPEAAPGAAGAPSGCADGEPCEQALEDVHAPVMRLARSAVRVDPNDGISLRLTCPADEVRCVGNVALRTIKRFGQRALRAMRRRSPAAATRVFLGERAFTVPGGRERSVRVPLTRDALALVRAIGTIRAEVTIIARDEGFNLLVQRRYVSIGRGARAARDHQRSSSGRKRRASRL
jgi:hypothetical protein